MLYKTHICKVVRFQLPGPSHELAHHRVVRVGVDPLHRLQPDHLTKVEVDGITHLYQGRVVHHSLKNENVLK